MIEFNCIELDAFVKFEKSEENNFIQKAQGEICLCITGFEEPLRHMARIPYPCW